MFSAMTRLWHAFEQRLHRQAMGYDPNQKLYTVGIGVEVYATSPEEAYAKTKQQLRALESAGLEWCPTLEWYGEGGEPVPTKTIHKIVSDDFDLPET